MTTYYCTVIRHDRLGRTEGRREDLSSQNYRVSSWLSQLINLSAVGVPTQVTLRQGRDVLDIRLNTRDCDRQVISSDQTRALQLPFRISSKNTRTAALRDLSNRTLDPKQKLRVD